MTGGIRLSSRVRVRGVTEVRAWPDERCEAWLEHARAIDAERDLGLELPTHLDDYERDEAGAVVVWPGYGNVAMADIGMTSVMTATRWQLLFTLTTAALRDEKRLAKGRPPCGWTAHGAVESLIAATRFLYKVADGAGLVARGHSPALEIAKPKRVGPGRSLLSEEQAP